ncbi:MAG TPA: hypothetical protein VFX10_02380 [Nitrospira sp.]|nr:hypothetical protein [Nitrospira sp.]
MTAASFGVQYLPNGPSFYQVLPFGAFYVWRHSGDYRERFRGSFALAVNDPAYNVGLPSWPGWELRFTLNNMIILLVERSMSKDRLSAVSKWSGITYSPVLELPIGSFCRPVIKTTHSSYL